MFSHRLQFHRLTICRCISPRLVRPHPKGKYTKTDTPETPERSHLFIYYSNCSNSQSSQSPDVFSPVGLAALPIVAPLASSPVDVTVHEHQRLASASPGAQELTFVSPKSPLHIALDTKLPDSPSIESLTSSQHSFTTITSPRDSNWDQPFQGNIFAVKLPDSPTSEHPLSPAQKSPPARCDQIGHRSGKLGAMLACRSLVLTFTVIARSTEVHVSDLPQPPASYSADGLREEDACSTPERSGTPPTIPYPRLHCRLCQSDPGVDLTATMCGHIFCYKYAWRVGLSSLN